MRLFEDPEMCIIVFLNQQLQLAKSTCETVETGFIYNDNAYAPVTKGGFNGHYDFLRRGDGDVIGISFYPSEDMYFLEKELEARVYTLIRKARDNSPIIDIFFSDHRSFEFSKSDDQEFGCNWLLSSKQRSFALTFNSNNIGRFVQDLERI